MKIKNDYWTLLEEYMSDHRSMKPAYQRQDEMKMKSIDWFMSKCALLPKEGFSH